MQEEQLMDRLNQCMARLKIPGVKKELDLMLADPQNLQKSQLEWLVQTLEAECLRRDTNALNERLKKAKLRNTMAEEANIIYTPDRNLEKSQIQTMVACEWIRRGQDCLITGKVGTGKTYLAECLAVAACRLGLHAKCARVPLLLKSMAESQSINGEYRAELRLLKKVDLLILDDWGLGELGAPARMDLLEIIEARHGCASTLITSVLPVSSWFAWIGDSTYADAILDRITANPIRIELKGESMRGKLAKSNNLAT